MKWKSIGPVIIQWSSLPWMMMDGYRHSLMYYQTPESCMESQYIQYPSTRIGVNVSRTVKNESALIMEIPTYQRKRVPSAPPTSMEGNFRLEWVHAADFNLSQIGGYREIKEELGQVIDIMKNRDLYEKYSVRMPKGLLLEGPPGNGKTLFARAVAGEVNFSYIATEGSLFNEKYVGVGASRVRELFEFARKNQPCLIFIDEMDAVAKHRNGHGEGSDSERDQTLNQLLTSLDGFTKPEQVFVIGATNRFDIIDKAILRPGRFDKIIHIASPDSETRSEIIQLHSRGKPLNISHQEMVILTSGFSGAQIENILNEATLFAIRNQSLPVTLKDFHHIRDRMIMGYSSSKKGIPLDQLRRIAVHEIGHLLVCLSSEHMEPPLKISIESNSPNNAGFLLLDTASESLLHVREYYEDRLKVLLAGRLAEELIYGSSVSCGAISDFEHALSLAKKMIISYGMGKRLIYPYFSEHSKLQIDHEIHRLLLLAHLGARSILEKQKSVLLDLVERLMDKKVLYYSEIVSIMLPYSKDST